MIIISIAVEQCRLRQNIRGCNSS